MIAPRLARTDNGGSGGEGHSDRAERIKGKKSESCMEAAISEIIAHALVDAGTDVVTHVPGYGANQIFDAYCRLASQQCPVSFNEEVAYSVAHGAGMVGARAATIIKAHGLAKAGNSVVDSLFAGTTAGFVNIIVEDETGGHSDSIFDTQAFLTGVGIPFIRAGGKGAYDGLIMAFEESEALSLPYVFLIEANLVDQVADFSRTGTPPKSESYLRDITRYFLQPVFGAYQRQVYEAKMQGEDWRHVPQPTVPNIPDDLPEDWRSKMRPYRGFFDVFRAFRGEIVTGEPGISHLFAFPPYDCLDLSTYMGGSVPLAVGACLAGYEDVWALTGDFSFLAAGHLGVAEVMQRRLPTNIVIFLNGKAGATGGQSIPMSVWERMMAGYSPYVRRVAAPQNKEEIHAVLAEVKNSEDLSIVVLDYRNC